MLHCDKRLPLHRTWLLRLVCFFQWWVAEFVTDPRRVEPSGESARHILVVKVPARRDLAWTI